MKIICDWDNCGEIGGYKAPLEKDNSRKYRLLCLEHIKLFNKKWNYFSDMTDQQIEYFVKSDLTWHKATKSFGSSESFFNILWNNALEDKNQGSRKFEDKLKKITLAYSQIKMTIGKK
jgi:hypothetical protein